MLVSLIHVHLVYYSICIYSPSSPTLATFVKHLSGISKYRAVLCLPILWYLFYPVYETDIMEVLIIYIITGFSLTEKT